MPKSPSSQEHSKDDICNSRDGCSNIWTASMVGAATVHRITAASHGALIAITRSIAALAGSHRSARLASAGLLRLTATFQNIHDWEIMSVMIRVYRTIR